MNIHEIKHKQTQAPSPTPTTQTPTPTATQTNTNTNQTNTQISGSLEQLVESRQQSLLKLNQLLQKLQTNTNTQTNTYVPATATTTESSRLTNTAGKKRERKTKKERKKFCSFIHVRLFFSVVDEQTLLAQSEEMLNKLQTTLSRLQVG